MAAAFQFDLVKLLGQSLENLLMANQWEEASYPDCYAFESTNRTLLTQAVLLKNEIKMVSFIRNEPSRNVMLLVFNHIWQAAITMNLWLSSNGWYLLVNFWLTANAWPWGLLTFYLHQHQFFGIITL